MISRKECSPEPGKRSSKTMEKVPSLRLGTFFVEFGVSVATGAAQTPAGLSSTSISGSFTLSTPSP